MKAPYDVVTVRVEVRQCQDCGYGYRLWPDGPHHCPRCVLGQPKPFAERREDPGEFLGAEWVWVVLRGHHGLWCPLVEYVLVDVHHWEAFCDILKQFPKNALPVGQQSVLTIIDELALKEANR